MIPRLVQRLDPRDVVCNLLVEHGIIPFELVQCVYGICRRISAAAHPHRQHSIPRFPDFDHFRLMAHCLNTLWATQPLPKV